MADEPASTADDPYVWLEDVTGDKALDWVRARNKITQEKFEADPAFGKLRDDLLKILDSKERIPAVSKHGKYLYNFWRDASNPRGLWRRTTMDEYRKPQPAWETVLDLDALAKAENENWVWAGAAVLKPGHNRVLIDLSRGGADANVTREFDIEKREFVKDGFSRPEAKGDMAWVDQDHVFVMTDFGKGSMTESGYPRVVKLWKRGTPMDSAKVVYEGKMEDMRVYGYHDDTPGFERNFVGRALAFYNNELFLRHDNGSLSKIDVPNSANKMVVREWLLLELRDAWQFGDKTYPAGSALAAKFDDFMGGKVKQFDVLFEPTDTTALASFTATKNYIILNVLEDVKNRLYVMKATADGWKKEPLKVFHRSARSRAGN